jgi:sodium/potassium-transporting ATPase subunit alpha
MNAAYERCGFMGERVIGFAYKRIAARSVDSFHVEGQGPPTEGLVFMGLMSLVDPPRPGVLEAVNKWVLRLAAHASIFCDVGCRAGSCPANN